MCNMCPFALTLYTIYYSVTRHAAKTLGKENIIKTSYKDYSIRAKFRNCRRKNILLSRRILSILQRNYLARVLVFEKFKGTFTHLFHSTDNKKSENP